MWESVEMRHVRAFLVLAEELHFGRAAERLHLSQSRVSQLIRTLETIVGTPLFDRNSRRVTLTQEGERLRSRAQPAYAELQRAVDELREATEGITGELRLGIFVPTSGGPRLTDIIASFEEAHPGSRVVISELAGEDPLGPLRRGEVDLIAIRFPLRQPDLTVGPVLTTDRRVLAVAGDHPLASRRVVTVEDLADQTIGYNPNLPTELTDAFTPQVTPSGQPIERRAVGNGLEMMTLVARAEIVHATVDSLPEYLSFPGIVYVPFADLPPSSAGLVWRTGAETPAIRAFATTARHVVGDPLRSSQP